MQTLAAITPLRAQLKSWRLEGKSIGFVPTMGNLHAGHLTLVQLARARADRVVVSVFVNPTQFGPAEDFAGYPRTLEEDKRLLVAEGVDMLFAPGVSDMYEDTEAHTARIEVPGLSDILCGAVRPGHFSGVATVVAKLFNIVQPDLAVFGEKDFQQLLVIRKLTADLNYPIEILGAPVGRESDGLAYSSRNRYLTPAERKEARVLWEAIRKVRHRVRRGPASAATLKRQVQALVDGRPRARLDYVEFFDPVSWSPVRRVKKGVHMALAVHLGQARLIDNARL